MKHRKAKPSQLLVFLSEYELFFKKKGVSENGADIVSALAGLNKPDVLLVGGVFGVIGYLFKELVIANLFAGTISPRLITDAPGITVFCSAILVRLIFGLAAFGLTFAVAGQPFFGCHHIVIIAAEAAVQSYATTGNAYMALAMGVIFGTISGLLADIAGTSINSGTDSHIDPPATAIFIMTFVVNAIFPVL